MMTKLKGCFAKTAKIAVICRFFSGSVYAAEINLPNVSYDPARELYGIYNEIFAKHYII
jgi:ABC-type sulfate transport system substrate-binding protein